MHQYISETELNSIISSTSLKKLCNLNILIAQKDEDKMLYVLSNIDALYNYSVQKHKSSYISHALELYKLCFWFDPCYLNGEVCMKLFKHYVFMADWNHNQKYTLHFLLI